MILCVCTGLSEIMCDTMCLHSLSEIMCDTMCLHKFI